MAKFVMECPKCHKFVQVNTGFLGIFGGKKKPKCSCGYEIDVNMDKITDRVCGHCGNHVVFDQSLGENAKCPVCGQPINTMEEQNQTVEFPCAQCGISLRASKSASTYTCPVCNHVNNVAERAMAQVIKKSGMASTIKYEGDAETLVWKHPVEDFNYGSQLIVHESQVAVFFRDGEALDTLPRGSHTLETKQLPLLEKFYNVSTPDTEITFHSEVYFINIATQMGIKWGTDSRVRLFDPGSGLHVEIGACGEFNMQVVNPRKLLMKVVGTTGGLKQNQLLGTDGKGFFRAMIMSQVKNGLASTIKECQISLLDVDSHLEELGIALKNRINPYIAEYGLEMPEFFISRILLPNEGEGGEASAFAQMKNQYDRQILGIREEQLQTNIAKAAVDRLAVEAQMKSVIAHGNAEAKKIGGFADADIEKYKMGVDAEGYRMMAAAEADEMRMKGYTYQQETARNVGMQALKNGIGGSGSSVAGGMGDIASMGIALGAMGGVINMTKDALNPIMNASQQMGQGISSVTNVTSSDQGTPAMGSWDCSCGKKFITSKFCPECGGARPLPQVDVGTWNCQACGMTGITSKFCPECGAGKPKPANWNCTKCGARDIVSKFCPECGTKRGE